jgi:hypothetical protein
MDRNLQPYVLNLRMLAQEKWIPHPYKPGTYIKRFGTEWKNVHNHNSTQPNRKIGGLPDCGNFYPLSFGYGGNGMADHQGNSVFA